MSKDLVSINIKRCATCLYWFSERELITSKSGDKVYKILQVPYRQYCFNKESCFYQSYVKGDMKCDKYLSKYIFEKILNEQ